MTTLHFLFSSPAAPSVSSRGFAFPNMWPFFCAPTFGGQVCRKTFWQTCVSQFWRKTCSGTLKTCSLQWHSVPCFIRSFARWVFLSCYRCDAAGSVSALLPVIEYVANTRLRSGQWPMASGHQRHAAGGFAVAGLVYGDSRQELASSIVAAAAHTRCP